MSIVLIGLPACGKTTVGRALADRLGLAFADTDALVEQRTGRSVREIFESEGEAGFRELECQAVGEALAGPGVVSLGGGAIMEAAVQRLVGGHQVVWLDAPLASLARRAEGDRSRPLLAGDLVDRLSALAAQRLPVYQRWAGQRVDADRPVERVVDQIVDRLRETRRVIQVTGDRSYQVVVGGGILGLSADPAGLDEGLAAKTVEAGDLVSVALAGATRTAIFHPPVLTRQAERLAAMVPGPLLVELPDGEPAKTVQQLERSWRRLVQAGFTRSDAVVGLGGGSTTDLAGFVAATLLRGVAYLACPTTVLAMADAAVGGKTGVNLPEGKNLVGAFYEPRAVLCDLDLLAGLAPAEVRSGLGEIIKCGFIADPAILEMTGRSPAEAGDTTTEIFAEVLTRAIRVKAEVVSTDFREEDGPGRAGRAALNYGHTLGHAIEKLEGFTWAHGAAVSVGMVFAAEVAHRLGLLDGGGLALHRERLTAVGLPISYDGASWEEVRAAMSLDKKARGSHLRLVLLEGIGHPVVVPDVAEPVLAEAYAAIRERA